MNNRIIKDTLKIFIITAVAGLLLGAVYVITKEPIAAAEEAAKQEAYRQVFTDGKIFEEMQLELDDVNKDLLDAGFKSECIDEIVAVKNEAEEILGYVFTATTSAGYGGDITISVGIKMDGTVNGYSVLSISETAGLGMKAKEKPFMSQFKNKLVKNFVVTKNGAKEENEIDAISGATITSDAVTECVNACTYYMGVITEGGDNNE